MTSRSRRLQKLSAHIDTLPLAPAVVQQAFERFRDTGEFPEGQRLAEAIVERVLRGDAEDDQKQEAFAPILRLIAQMIESGELPSGPPAPPRVRLFREAVREPGAVRSAARLAFRLLAWDGRNLAAPGLLDDVATPDGDAVGPHVIATLLPRAQDRPGDMAYAEALQQRVRAGEAKLAAEFDRAAKATTGRHARALTSVRRALSAPPACPRPSRPA